MQSSNERNSELEREKQDQKTHYEEQLKERRGEIDILLKKIKSLEGEIAAL